MKNNPAKIVIIVVLLIVAAYAAYWLINNAISNNPSDNSNSNPSSSSDSSTSDSTGTTTITSTPLAPSNLDPAVTAAINGFAAAIKKVNLLVPTSTAAAEIQQDFSPYVAQDILTSWETNPIEAPGILSTTATPSQLSVVAVEQNSDNSYDVEGQVIEVNSQNQAVDQYTLSMKFRNQNGKWLITGIVKEVPQQQ